MKPSNITGCCLNLFGNLNFRQTKEDVSGDDYKYNIPPHTNTTKYMHYTLGNVTNAILPNKSEYDNTIKSIVKSYERDGYATYLEEDVKKIFGQHSPIEFINYFNESYKGNYKEQILNIMHIIQKEMPFKKIVDILDSWNPNTEKSNDVAKKLAKEYNNLTITQKKIIRKYHQENKHKFPYYFNDSLEGAIKWVEAANESLDMEDIQDTAELIINIIKIPIQNQIAETITNSYKNQHIENLRLNLFSKEELLNLKRLLEKHTEFKISGQFVKDKIEHLLKNNSLYRTVLIK